MDTTTVTELRNTITDFINFCRIFKNTQSACIRALLTAEDCANMQSIITLWEGDYENKK